MMTHRHDWVLPPAAKWAMPSSAIGRGGACVPPASALIHVHAADDYVLIARHNTATRAWPRLLSDLEKMLGAYEEGAMKEPAHEKNRQ